MPMNEIETLKELFVAQLHPISVYLFGSFATGQSIATSDIDFYIVVDDEIPDLPAVTTQAYQAIRNSKQHPVDIIVGRESRFENRKLIPSVENEVYENGVLLYESRNRTVA